MEYALSQEVLRTDVSGMPLEWINYQDAVRLYHGGQVAYSLGVQLFRIRGGINALSRRRSIIEVNSIVATWGSRRPFDDGYTPPLSNSTLFKRDFHICLYCGTRFSSRDLSRDHITPLSKRGEDSWTNVATACKRCNNHKAGRTPEEARLQLIAVPFTPTYAEYIFLKGRRVLMDQMEFLVAQFPRNSPIHDRLKRHH